MRTLKNKRIRTGLLTAALAGGTVIGATQVGGIVDAAQADNSAADDDDTPADTDDVTSQDRREARREARQQNHQEVADLIGVDVDDLGEWLRNGGTLAEVATENGVSVDAVEDLLVAQANERIDQAVENGRVDADEAAEKRAEVEERVTTLVNEGRPDREERQARREARREARQENHQEVADLLGVDVDDLRDRLRSGETLADVAADSGVEVDAVVNLLVAQANERIDQAVENGRVDADEAAEKRAEVEERVATRVNEGRPERPEGEGRGPRGGDGAPAVDDVEG